ncbi:ketosynthase chain-length factor [Kineococcus sp. NPDC059986]|uniref:ketosynthase chain-length factor n=1 Tax=Kineococcus sp. NPDC059986 TaxID=3155538 RepID=UPI00344D2B3F
MPRSASDPTWTELLDPVVTGVGVASPTGLGLEEFWAATVAGSSGLGPVTRFDASGYPCGVAGEVPGFDAAAHVPSRLLPQTDHMTRLALAVATEALDDAAVDPADLSTYAAGVVTAASGGGVDFGQRELQNLHAHGADHVSAYQSFAWFYAVNTGQVSIRNRLRGPCAVLVTEQAGGLDSLGQARRTIRRGTPLVVGGGVDSGLSPWGWAAQLATGRTSTGHDPAQAYLPFAPGAAGSVPGEGGALLVLEDPAAAAARGARVHATLAGYAATFDPAGGSRPDGLRRAVDLALADAGLAPHDVDVVFADGAALPAEDRSEAEVLVDVFGPRGVPVTVPKAGTGRLAAGGGALDVATAVLALEHGTVPPTPGVAAADPRHRLDLVTGRARELPLRTALVLARGTGGFHSAVVLRRA